MVTAALLAATLCCVVGGIARLLDLPSPTDLAAASSDAGAGLGAVSLVAGAVALCCVWFGLCRGAGPIAPSRAQVAWWLPLPVSRRGLLLHAYAMPAAVGAGLLGGVGACALAAGGADAGEVVAGAIAVAAAATLLHALATVEQLRGRRGALVDRSVDIAPAAALASVVILGAGPENAWGSGLLSASGGRALVLVLVLVLGAAVAVGAVVRALDDAPTSVLEAAAGQREQHTADVLSMRAPTTRGRGARPRARPARGRRPRRAPTSPARVVLRAHGLAWVRTPAVLPRLATTALVPAAATTMLSTPDDSQTAAALVAVATIVATFRAVHLAAAGVRTLAQSPAFRSLIPVAPGVDRALCAVVPTMVLFAWAVATGASATAVGAAPSGWPVLVGPLAVGLGAAATRGATRGDPDWSMPLLATPAGPLPWGWVVWFARGRVEVLALLAPVLAASSRGIVSPATICVTAAVALVTMGLAQHASPRAAW